MLKFTDMETFSILRLKICLRAPDILGPGMLRMGNSTNKLNVVFGTVFFDEG